MTMLEFRIEWESAPGVADAVLRETWARLEVRLDGAPISRYWSEQTRSLRDGVYCSVFPLAEWIANHWWALLFERARHPFPATISARRRGPSGVRDWLARHNTLTCRDGMAYPDLSIFRQDEDITLSWNQDPASTTTPGRFIDEGMATVDHGDAEAALESFVGAVIERTRELHDAPAEELRALWSAIMDSRRSEATTCARLAMLGMDPYGDGLDELVVETLEGLPFPEPIIDDLLSASASATLHEDINWTTSLLDELRASPAHARPHSTPRLRDKGGSRPYEVGYRRAAAVRKRFGLPADAPLPALTQLIEALIGQEPQVSWRHCDRSTVEAAVQSNGSAAIVASQRSEPGQRFLLGRALHHWLFVNEDSVPRLLTRGQDWSQAASRAFSAELLAPSQALAARLGSGADWGERQEELAREFNVSSMVIAHQMANHRLG